MIFFVFNNRRYGVLQNVARSSATPMRSPAGSLGMEVADPAIDFQALAASMGVPAARADDRPRSAPRSRRGSGARPVADRDPNPLRAYAARTSFASIAGECRSVCSTTQ